MKIPAHDEGLVKMYVDKIDALGVIASQGSLVIKEVVAVAHGAIAHFASVKTSTEIGNLKKFSRCLAARSMAARGSQPHHEAAFNCARTIVDNLIERKKGG